MQVAHIRPWREDVQNVKAMREAMGGGIEIIDDGQYGWDADTAIQAGHRIDEFDPYWLEEPVVAEDFAGYRRIAAALKTRSSALLLHAQRPASLLRNAVRAHPVRLIHGRLHRAAQDRGRRRALGHPHRPHLFHETMVHVLATIPTPTTSNTWTGTTISGSSRCCRRRTAR